MATLVIIVDYRVRMMVREMLLEVTTTLGEDRDQIIRRRRFWVAREPLLEIDIQSKLELVQEEVMVMWEAQVAYYQDRHFRRDL